MKPSIALVGIGKIAVDQHLPSIAATGLFELKGLVHTRAIPNAPAPVHMSLEALFEAVPDLDCVGILTPPAIRWRFVRQALLARKHVLMEKPPTTGLAAFDDLVRTAEAADRTLFATWHSRFNPAVDEAAHFLVGRRIVHVDVTWKEDVRRWHPGQEWIWKAGGFGVFDPGINAVSILTRILPFALVVTEAQLLYPANRATPLAARIGFTGAQGGAYRAEFDWRQEGDQTWDIRVETEEGHVVLLQRGGTVLTIDGKPVISETDQEYPRIYRRFHELVTSGTSDADPAPLRFCADCLLAGERVETDAFHW
jgi:D-galactose 1-dehydrogenase